MYFTLAFISTHAHTNETKSDVKVIEFGRREHSSHSWGVPKSDILEC